jgi:hypothetical protein
VNTLRPHGKRVVVIGVSWTTAVQLTDQADVVLYYDMDVEPLIGDAPPPVATAPTTTKKLPPKLVDAAETALQLIHAQGTQTTLDARVVAEVLALSMEITHEYRDAHREFSVSLLGQELQKKMNGGEFQRVGKGRSRVFAQALAAHGLVKLISRNFVDWLFLPDEAVEFASTAAATFDSPRYDYAGFVYADLPFERQQKLLGAIYDERHRPGTDWLTFTKVLECAMPIVGRDEYATKNLVNNMLVVEVLKFDPVERQGRDPATGTAYSYRTISLDLQHPDVRRALHLP